MENQIKYSQLQDETLVERFFCKKFEELKKQPLNGDQIYSMALVLTSDKQPLEEALIKLKAKKEYEEILPHILNIINAIKYRYTFEVDDFNIIMCILI